MKAGILATVLAVFASQANALSCMRPDPIETFKRVTAAPEDYFVLHGQLTFDKAQLPAGVSENPNPQPAPIAAFFRGKGLTLQGFTSDYISPVSLQPTCAGPWCGSASNGVDAVFFVRAATPTVTIQAEPCGGLIFENPSPATLEMLTSCMRGAACTSTQSLK